MTNPNVEKPFKLNIKKTSLSEEYVKTEFLVLIL